MRDEDFIPADDDMTLRDYFAAKAMQGIIGTSAAPMVTGTNDLETHISKTAYKLADAMLEARHD